MTDHRMPAVLDIAERPGAAWQTESSGIVGPTRRNRRRLPALLGVTIGASALVVSVVATAAFVLGLGADVDRARDAPAVVAQATPAVPAPVEDTGPGSTLDDPAPAGSTVVVEAWDGAAYSISFGTPVWDAGAAVQSENEFNAPAGAGLQYAIVPLTYTNIGADDTAGSTSTDTVDPSYEAFGVSFVGADGVAQPPASVVIANDAIDAEVLLPGETVTVHQVFEVPVGTTDGVWVTETGLFVDAQ